MEEVKRPAEYDHLVTEEKWRKKWEDTKLYEVDIENAKNPFYNLMMFPYPSAEGLHVGNVFAFTGSDIYGRFKRLNGFDVFEPMGFDAFGIHSENFAIKIGTHPAKLIPKNIYHFREDQLKKIGAMFAWDHQVDTTNPNYYKWTQWVFVQLYKAGLAYKKKASVNWCPSCKTVLADEQVEGGGCERCKTVVEKRDTEQWFFRITDYAQRLLDNLSWIDWSDITKGAQRRWLGRSEGAEIDFDVEGIDEKLKVFTTRPDTLHGATYMVIAPEHRLVSKLAKGEHKKAVEEYVEEARNKDNIERENATREKTGVFTGSYAVNPLNGKQIPIWVADYVLAGYGTGAIMAVPAHDTRDFEFAKKFDLPIIQVISTDGKEHELNEAYTEDGKLINSGQFNGLSSDEAISEVIKYLEAQGKGTKKVNFQLHDWCISRQRYWGPPIPIVYCDKCGTVHVPEEQLPVKLPDVEDFKPKGEGTSPLANIPQFINTTCPKCGGPAKRESDVMDNFLDSAWYFFRYPCTQFDDRPFDKEVAKKWLPVDMYIGGNEHAVLHLMYTRFITMVFKDLGFIDFEEPFKKFRAHGLLIKDGNKMSKSRGNVVNPDQYINEFGADCFRMYLMFLGPYQEGGDFRDSGINGTRRFIDRIYRYYTEAADKLDKTPFSQVNDKGLLNIVHSTIKKATEDLESLKYNTAIARCMEMFNYISKENVLNKEVLEDFIIMLSPFIPYLAEELWEMMGNSYSIFNASWPKYDESKIGTDEVELVIQVNGKIVERVNMAVGSGEEEVFAEASKSEKLSKLLQGKIIVKKIFVQDKLMNIVVR